MGVTHNGRNNKECRVCHRKKLLQEFLLSSKSPDGFSWVCRSCRHKHRVVEDHDQVWADKAQDRLRQEFIRVYGGACYCCGEKNFYFLTMEHLDGSGAEHRKSVGSGSAVFRDLRRRGWPMDGTITVACFNCNMGRERTPNKTCPHKEGGRNG